ncbi:RecQ family ATP-dependent DNA helicase [Runella salmonicolor]|uniref:ATP-dependent DNA helicase RecQ n=1 Tax=Runella salmonicolor TaxID=2950278 RepID=A0ABT1FWJ1_9BACT|nr:ATP-dependent DNA helicase RecQ [Runella salmonicolor]MCP1385123.1 RecQ family ATP-dependent DNA helicase [Runella salmonicolor]
MIHEILKQYWGYNQFRPLQEEIIQSVLAKRDTLALLPTGGGKSLCFQIPALAMEGVCIVVTPLIALMKDQVEQLRRRHIMAAAIYSGMNWHEIDIVLDNCIHGTTKFLYVSPERLRADIFLARAKMMKINLLAIDEAHCISQWGYDFRPSYLQIADFHALIPGVPIIALTASATEPVKLDICEKLQMREPAVFQATFARSNLSYSAFFEENKDARLVRILQNVPGSAIIYVRNRRRTKEVADWLNRQGIRAEFYHAGIPTNQRGEIQEAWIRNRVRVMVATNAFGMGIDKPDVRVVIHIDLPDNLEAYYQEAGRAGRDGLKAYAVALYSPKDLNELVRNVEQKYPPIELVRRVYQALANFYRVPVGGGELEYFDFDLQAFTGTFGLPASETHYVIKLLEEEGFLQLSDAYNSSSKIHIVVDNRALYDLQLKYPQYDSFIKLLLRMYGGEIFTQFVNISETIIAQKHYIMEPDVVKMLQSLHDLGVLVYEKQRDKPQLSFLTPRYDADMLPINALAIQEKHRADLERIEAVANYVQHSTRCRTQLLQQYFGEHTDERCGICDNCLAKKKKTPANPENGKLKAEILRLLNLSPLTPQQLVASFGIKNEQAAIDTIRELLEDEVVVYEGEGTLRLRQ